MNAILIGNDSILEVTGLLDEVTGAYLNSATVTARLKTAAAVDVAGEITLGYVAASNGHYRGTLEDGLVLVAGKIYTVEITADAGADLIAFWRVEVMAKYRAF